MHPFPDPPNPLPYEPTIPPSSGSAPDKHVFPLAGSGGGSARSLSCEQISCGFPPLESKRRSRPRPSTPSVPPSFRSGVSARTPTRCAEGSERGIDAAPCLFPLLIPLYMHCLCCDRAPCENSLQVCRGLFLLQLLSVKTASKVTD